MTTQRIFTSRSQHASNTYIGAKGQLFYNEFTGALRLSDGVTPGGISVAIDANLITTESVLPDVDNVYGIGTELLRWNHIHLGDGGIYFDGTGYPYPQTVPYLPSALTGSLVPATDNGVNLGSTSTRFANIYLGYEGLFLADTTTDANINITVNSGTLYVSGAANLAIGNLVIEDTTLKSFTNNLDINIGETNDTGFFYVRRKAQFDNVSFGSTEAMVSLNASGGADPATVFPDTVLQTVSRPNKNSRIVQRSYGSTGNVGGDNSYAVWASYAARGNTAAPAALKANDILARVSANGYGTSTWGSGGARMEFVALENFTDTAKGTRINFWTTPAGQIASQNVASINSVGVIAAGIEFSGDSTVQTTAGIPLTAKAVSSATYVATLGVDGKLDATQIPSALTGAIVFKGVWNATTNTPALSDTTPAGLSTGWEYIVEVGGTRDIGDGSKTFLAGDFVIYDGTHWKQVPSGNAFVSLTGGGHITVNQSTGAIVLGSDATPNATTATIVSRDASGNFSANVITANLTGVVTGSVSGNAGSVTNGVYTTGDQTIGGTKTFTSTIQGTITSATTAASLLGGIGVASLAGSSGTSVSASTGAVTVWFNTSTLVAQAVSATTATNAGYAYSFNTGTLVTNAVTAQTAGTVTTAAQPAITSVGTLTNISVSGNIRYDQTQNNGTATQITSKSTAVTCNGRTGQITTHNANINKGASVKFTVNNSTITSAKDVVIVNIASGASVPYSVTVNNVNAAGSFDISLSNSDSTPSGSNAADTLVINFAIVKVS